MNAQNIVRKGGTGKDRTQFGNRTFHDAVTQLAPDSTALPSSQKQAISKITSAAKLHEIAATTTSPHVRFEVARNKHTAAQTINGLARVAQDDVTQFALLLRPELNAAEVNRLAQSKFAGVRKIARARTEFVPKTFGQRLEVAFGALVHGRLQTV